MTKYEPSEFHIKIRHDFAGPSTEIRFLSDGLLYNGKGLDRSGWELVKLSPVEEEWLTFWDTLDRLGVWSWLREYVHPTAISDGIVWRFRIHYGKQVLNSRGSNVFPPHGEIRYSPEFNGFCRAVSRLCRGRPVLGEID